MNAVQVFTVVDKTSSFLLFYRCIYLCSRMEIKAHTDLSKLLEFEKLFALTFICGTESPDSHFQFQFLDRWEKIPFKSISDHHFSYFTTFMTLKSFKAI